MRDLEFDIKAKDRTGSGFDSAEARAKRFNSVIDASATAFNLAAVAAKAFVAGMALQTIEEAGRAIRAAITDAADMVDLADKVGLTTDELQRLTHGFEVAGVASSSIEMNLTQWSRRIGEAYTQGGRLADILKANGVSLTDANGKLRSSVDLMRDYADLIANAASSQERNTLATVAFGEAGTAMVLALRDGAAGVDKLMHEVEKTGGVIEDELLQRAAELDDRLNEVGSTIRNFINRELLIAASAMDSMMSSFRSFDPAGASDFALERRMKENGRERIEIENEILRLRGESGLSDTARDLGFKETEDPRIADLQAREKALRGEEKAILDVMATRRAEAEAIAAQRNAEKPTIIPGGSDRGSSGSRAATKSALREQESAYDRVIKKLQEEQELLGLNAVDQRILTEQRRAGVTAASDQGQAIAAMVRHIDGEREAMERTRREAEEFNRSLETGLSTVSNTILSIVDGSDKASVAIAKLAVNFAFAAAQAALFNSGPLAGLFGGSGLFGGAASSASSPGNWSFGLNDFQSFDGGGWTGSGDRTGGLDGKGGFLALMHPQETVVDHTRGGGMQNVTFNITTPDASSFMKSRGQVETMMARAVARGNRGL